MRIKLDSHPWIRCGAEPMVTMDVLHLWETVTRRSFDRALKAGIYPDAINNATKSYIQQIVELMGPDAPILCHKQPHTFIYLKLLGNLFPQAKFVHLIRDGRGAVASSMR